MAGYFAGAAEYENGRDCCHDVFSIQLSGDVVRDLIVVVDIFVREEVIIPAVGKG